MGRRPVLGVRPFSLSRSPPDTGARPTLDPVSLAAGSPWTPPPSFRETTEEIPTPVFLSLRPGVQYQDPLSCLGTDPKRPRLGPQGSTTTPSESGPLVPGLGDSEWVFLFCFPPDTGGAGGRGITGSRGPLLTSSVRHRGRHKKSLRVGGPSQFPSHEIWVYGRHEVKESETGPIRRHPSLHWERHGQLLLGHTIDYSLLFRETFPTCVSTSQDL